MTRQSNRPPKMADLAILIGGTALALGLWRMSWDDLSSRFNPGVKHLLAYRMALTIAPALLGFASALLALRLVPPRPRWILVFRQPGTSACVAILGQMLSIVLTFSWHVFLVPIVGSPIYPPRYVSYNTYLEANREAGAWVAVAWATLALARAWRPEPSWIDRAGRVLGVLAILHWLWSATIW